MDVSKREIDRFIGWYRSIFLVDVLFASNDSNVYQPQKTGDAFYMELWIEDDRLDRSGASMRRVGGSEGKGDAANGNRSYGELSENRTETRVSDRSVRV